MIAEAAIVSEMLPVSYVKDLMSGTSPLGTGILAMLKAYYDDSGTHDGSLVVSVAGYVGEDDQWTEFQRNWNDILIQFNHDNACDVTHMHIADLIGGFGKQYKGLDETKRVALLSSLCTLARVRSIRGIGSFIMTSDYTEILGHVDDRPPGCPAPFTLCAEGAFLMTKGWALKAGRKDSIGYFIEKGTKHRGEILSGFDRAQKANDLGASFRFDTLAQGPKEIVGLQLADVYVWTLAAEQKGTLDHLSKPFQRELKSFLYGHPHEHLPWDKPMLERCVLDPALQHLDVRNK